MDIVFSLGASIIVFAIIYYSLETLLDRIQINTMSTQFNLVASRLETQRHNRNTYLLISAITGAIIGFYLTAGTAYIVPGSMGCLVLGTGITKGIFYILDKKKESDRGQECFLLFNTVEIFLQSGLSIPQSLVYAREFTPLLAEDINKSLAAWPTGPVEALDVLKKSINLPEGTQLASLLLQVSQAGSQNLAGILQSESQQMARKRQAAEKSKITKKPIFLIIYRFLPLVILLGLVAGVMLTRVFAQMKGML